MDGGGDVTKKGVKATKYVKGAINKRLSRTYADPDNPTFRETLWIIWDYLVLFFIFLLIAIICVIIYKVVIQGYYNFFVNLLSLHFYHEEDLDKFIQDEDKIANIFKYLIYEERTFISNQTLFDGCTYALLMDEINQLMKNMYKKVSTENERFLFLLREYYLFYNVLRLDVNHEDNQKKIKNHTIRHSQFYIYLLSYKKKHNLLTISTVDSESNTGKGDDKLLLDFYYSEIKNPSPLNTIPEQPANPRCIAKTPENTQRWNELNKPLPTLENMLRIQYKIDEIKKYLEFNFIKSPTIPFLLPLISIPKDDDEIIKIQADVSKYRTIINDESIYIKKEYEELSDFVWIMIEYLTALKNKKWSELEKQYILNYDELKKEMEYILNDIYVIETAGIVKNNIVDLKKRELINKIRNYINLTGDLKPEAEKRIINVAIKQKCPDQTKCKYKLVRLHAERYKKLFDFIKKRPIFSNIYFSTKINMSKSRVYTLLFENIYQQFGGLEGLKQYSINATKFKKVILNSTILYLYLSVYRKEMTEMYEKKYLPPSNFFYAMWNPYKKDVMQNRLKYAFKQTFNRRNWKKNERKFMIWYKQLGKKLNKMIKSVFKAFFTSKSIEQPHEDSLED
jgi:hypothetical protein